jgi:signal transduction histidine kinase
MSIRLRLTLWYSGLLAVLLATAGLLVYEFVYHNTIADLKRRLVEEAAKVQVKYQPTLVGSIILQYQPAPSFDMDNMGIQIVSFIQDPGGEISDNSENLERYGIRFDHPPYFQVKEGFTWQKGNGTPFLVYNVPLLDNVTHQLVGLKQVGVSTSGEQKMFSQLKTVMGVTGLSGLVASFLMGLFLARKALRPIERVTEAAEQIQSSSELDVRIPREKPNDEIGRLTDTLNGMLARLERTYKELEESNAAQRRFVSDASHELRTPLTTIRGNVDLLEKVWRSQAPSEEREQLSLEAIRDIADEARRMSRLVNDMLSLARADAGYVMAKEPIELRPLAEEAARRAAFLPRTADWRIGSLEALDGVRVLGNRDYLLQLLFILIENGFKYTPEGRVWMEASRIGDKVGLTVADTGIGMSREEMQHIFERFYRADVSRGKTSGTGLGLSIAKWIADMHQGTIEVQSEPGAGSAFTVWLPIDFSRQEDYDIMESAGRPPLPHNR